MSERTENAAANVIVYYIRISLLKHTLWIDMNV